MLGLLALGIFTICMFVNVPVSISMGLASGVCLCVMGISGMIIPQKMLAGIQSWVLLSVPFFILAAQIMNRGGVAERLFTFANELVGWVKGGLGHANVLASMIFAGISGAAVADASGLGMLEIKVMTEAGYDKKFAVGVTAASCMLGPIIPPSIMLILYGYLAEISIAALWLAGIIPGIITGFLLMAYIYITVLRGKIICPAPKKFSLKNACKSFTKNIFVIILPVLLLWLIISGLATPTETGVVAAVYTFILAFFNKKKAFLRDIPRILVGTVKSSGIIIFIISIANALVWIISVEKTTDILSQFLFSLSSNKYVLLLFINIFLIIIGALIEQIPALLIIVPILTPIGAQLGINPFQFGLMIVFNLMVGLITPPMGMALFIMGAITDVPMKDIIISSLRFFFILCFALILITYFPIFTTLIPEMFGYIR